jgi:hypothetical protein
VGSVLVHNEDVFIERAIRNVADVCDRIYAFDHQSSDRTPRILHDLAREFDHLEVQSSPRTRDSQKPLEQYAGTATWVLGIDGDELFDPAALAQLKEQLLAGEHADVFRLKGHVLNCDELDWEARTAAGYMAPPSRPITKLFNFSAVDSWTGSSQRLHDGQPAFRPGYHWESMRYLYELGWDDDPLRCLHVCFVRRSSRDAEDVGTRRNINETGLYDRSVVGTVKRALRGRLVPRDVAELHSVGTDWKRAWYARGDRVSVDATPFLDRSP